MSPEEEVREEFRALSEKPQFSRIKDFLVLASNVPEIYELGALAARDGANTWLHAATVVIPDFPSFTASCVKAGRLTSSLKRTLARHRSELEKLVVGRTVQATVPERSLYVRHAVGALDLTNKTFGLVDIGCGPGFMAAAIARDNPSAAVVGVEPYPPDLNDPAMLHFALMCSTEPTLRAFHSGELTLQDIPPIVRGSGLEGARRGLALLSERGLPEAAPVVLLNSWTVHYWAEGQSEEVDDLVDSDSRFIRVEIETPDRARLTREQWRVLNRITNDELGIVPKDGAPILAMTARISGGQRALIGVGDLYAETVIPVGQRALSPGHPVSPTDSPFIRSTEATQNSRGLGPGSLS